MDGTPTTGAGEQFRVFVACSGLGRARRGFETFAAELAEALAPLEGVDVTLMAGAGPRRPGQVNVPSLSRAWRLSRTLGKLIRDPPEIPGIREYIVEQVTFALALVPLIWRDRPDVVLTSDPHLGKVLIRLRPLLPRGVRMLLSNGAPLPPPFPGWDHVHHTSAETFTETMRVGASPSRHTLLPYGVKLSRDLSSGDSESRRHLRAKLDLPADAPILLSVGAMNSFHKRMDYVIREVARIETKRPHLVILGDRSQASEIEQLAVAKLGSSGVTLRTVPQEQVVEYYDAADAFILASIREGFGLVYVEALARGLTCIAHDSEHTRTILSRFGELADLSQPGHGETAILRALKQPQTDEGRAERAAYAHDTFSWEHLAPRYRDMLLACARSSRWEAQ